VPHGSFKMGDLQEIIQQLQKMAAENEAYRQEQARLREIDKREQAKHRLLDREYLDQRLLSMETSFSQKLSDVTSALTASSSTISSQSSKRSRESFERAIQHNPDEDDADWFAEQPLWDAGDDAEVAAEQPLWEDGDHAEVAASEPPPPGTLKHTQMLSPARAHTDMGSCVVMKVLPSDNPKQCLLCGDAFKHKRFCKMSALTSLHL